MYGLTAGVLEILIGVSLEMPVHDRFGQTLRRLRLRDPYGAVYVESPLAALCRMETFGLFLERIWPRYYYRIRARGNYCRPPLLRRREYFSGFV